MATANSSARQLEHMKGKATVLVEANINQMLAFIHAGDINNSVIYAKACWNLGSGIDLAIAMNEVPSSSHLQHLPGIVKAVFWRKTITLQPPLMVLMLSIKGACRIGWFPDKDKDDLLKLAEEVGNGLYNTEKMCIEPSHAPSSVSNIISRYYPQMKLESILVSFDVKAGYGIYVSDFPISRGTLPPQCRNLWLLVARVDNMDTSACITNPPNTDFLINGKGVPGRIKADMGKGPQLPTNITKAIKFGVNLLQVFGDLDGQYLVIVAFMNLISSPDPPQLQDYVHPVSDGVDSDCDVIEMSSRISLNCPISQDRIRTPVKGHLCKHPQCFDYKNFMEINSRRPTWRCPLCSHPVCYLDLCIDQKIVTILNQVEDDISDVIISADGSWKGVTKKSRSTEPNSTTLSDQGRVGQPSVPSVRTNHVPDDENHRPTEANSTRHNSSSGLRISDTATTDANFLVPLHRSEDSRSQTWGVPIGLYTRGVAPSVQPNRHHPIANPTQAPHTLTRLNHHQPPAQPDGTSHATIGSTEQPQPRFSFAPVQLTPPMTTSPHSLTTAFEQLRRGGEQGRYTSPSEPQPPAQTQLNAGAATQQTAALRLQPPSGDAMPSGRMRGSLRGNELEQARLQFLSPPTQPARANEPWSRPTLTLPIALRRPQPTTNSHNTPMVQNNQPGSSGSLPK